MYRFTRMQFASMIVWAIMAISTLVASFYNTSHLLTFFMCATMLYFTVKHW